MSRPVLGAGAVTVDRGHAEAVITAEKGRRRPALLLLREGARVVRMAPRPRALAVSMRPLWCCSMMAFCLVIWDDPVLERAV